MLFGKKFFWESFDGRFSIEEGGDAGGGGGVAAAEGNSPDTFDSGAAGDSGSQGAGDSGSGSGEGGSSEFVLDGAPGERGSQEYIEWFNELPHDQRVRVEQEWMDGYEQKSSEEGEGGAAGQPPEGEGGKPPEGSGEGQGGNTDPNDVGEWTPEEFAALDESSQARIKSMQGIIDKVAPYLDGSLEEGMRIIQEDPIIKARMEEIQGKGEYAMPESVSKEFNVSDYLTDDDAKHFQLLDDAGKAAFAKIISHAYENGAKQGGLAEQYNSKEALLREQRVNTFTRELNAIVADTPSLSVPNGEDGNPVPFKDPSHPLNPYLVWAGQNMSDDMLANIGHKAGYAAYLAATGKQDEAMNNVAKHVRTTFLKNMDNMDKQVATTAGRQSQTPGHSKGRMWNDIDLDKYRKDETYARQVFGGADHATRKKLEQFRFDDKVPT